MTGRTEDLKTIAVLVGHTTTVMVGRVATEIYGAAMDRLCEFTMSHNRTLP